MSTGDSTEFDRLVALHRTGLLDTRPEAAYDAIVAMACEVAGVPIALVSLVDTDRQWFKARVGLEAAETPRDVAFCSHAIATPAAPFVVENASEDPRFCGNPLVVGDPAIRFYAGFPIVDDAGHGLGTLCVIDREPRRLSVDQMTRLRSLADVAQELVRLRGMASDLDEARGRAVLFERGFDAAGVGNQLVDRDGRLLRINQAFADMIGRAPDELIGRPWWEFAHPDSVRPNLDLERQPDSGQVTARRTIGRYIHANGSVVWAVIQVVPVFFDASSERLDYVQVTNITDAVEARRQAEDAATELARSERRLASLIDPAPDPVVRLTGSGVIEAMNPAAVRALCPEGRSLVGHHASDLAVPRALFEQVWASLIGALETGAQREISPLWFEPVAGPPGWYRVRMMPVAEPDGPGGSVFFTASNITSAVENEQRLAALALVDPLTGAANRAALYDRLDQALGRLERGSSAGVAVGMIDLDHFKSINDTYGHDTGDAALTAVVDALRSAVRAHDTVARLGGDEFVVMFDDVDEDQMMQTLAPRITEQIARVNIPLHDGAVSIRGSVGVAWTPKQLPGRDLIAQADNALLQAKRHGRNRLWTAHTTTGQGGPFTSDTGLRRDLTQALHRDQFSLRYQPIQDRSGRTTAIEALLRWDHPDHGTIVPALFMNVLIETGLIATVGHWVLRQAIVDAASINATRAAPVAVHVNLSPSEIASTQLSSLVRSLLREHDLEPATLVIEVTEQSLAGTTVSSSAMSELAATGVQVALDDFGTGTSSLSHLRHRALRGVKLDRSFVNGIGHDHIDMAILAGAIGIARELGLDVVAEGVETSEQRSWLLDRGCTHLQGWLTGHPTPLESLELA